MRLSSLLLIALGCPLGVFAQSATSVQPAATAQTTAAPASTPPVAYEAATLPKDRVQAWEMLRAASGLSPNDETLQPWYMHGHYKIYDVYGKPAGDGTIEYVWTGPKQWRKSYTEGAATWTQWGTEKGVYQPPNQDILSYPASLILPELTYPLGLGDVAKKAPAFLTTETFGKTTLLCFTSGPLRGGDVDERFGRSKDFTRVCTLPDKPVLLMTQWDYDDFFDEFVSFQHRVVAQHILIKYSGENVVDIYLDTLRLLNDKDRALLEPASNAVGVNDRPASGIVLAGHLVKKVKPTYPGSMRQKRIQGSVILAITVQKDGKTMIDKVLHSPAPELTDAAEAAVKQWVYTPYLLDGKPSELKTQVRITFVL